MVKRGNPIWLLTLSALLLASCSAGVRDIEGNSYATVKIGSQQWTSGNLNSGHFRNGDAIQEAKTPEEWIKLGREGKPAWCSYQNDPGNALKYGRLYNWYAVNDPRGLAPEGWHIPSDEEWTAMTGILGGGVMAALKMRVTGMAGSGNENKGFSGLPGGARSVNGAFYGMGSYGYWWSSTESSATASWMRVLNYEVCDINNISYDKGTGLSVRCVRN